METLRKNESMNKMIKEHIISGYAYYKKKHEVKITQKDYNKYVIIK